MALFPHMHLRGSAATYWATYPNGETEMLLDVPRYDFNWQTNYIFKEPKHLPAGTRVDVKLVYDNSPENAARSGFNANRNVRWGGPTTDEMAVGFFDYTLSEPMPAPQEIPLLVRRRMIEFHDPRAEAGAEPGAVWPRLSTRPAREGGPARQRLPRFGAFSRPDRRSARGDRPRRRAGPFQQGQRVDPGRRGPPRRHLQGVPGGGHRLRPLRELHHRHRA